MASTINADDGVVSGSAGVKTSADNSGVLELQSSGTTQFTLGSSSVVINEAGADVDFRVEGDTDPNLFVVDASTDRIGMGTNAPSSKLHLSGAATADARLTFTQTTAGLSGQIQQGSTGFAISALGTNSLLFDTNGVNRAVIDTSGNLGIGTTSPSYKLDVRGSTDTSYLNITSTADANGTTLRIGTDATAAFINATGGSSGTLQLRTYGTTKATLDNSGNLGLGVTPSAWPGQAANYDAFQFGTGAVYNVADTATEIAYNQYIDSAGTRRYITTNTSHRYRIGNTEHSWFVAASGTAGDPISFTQAMTLDASGRLGIGTSVPNRLLDIATTTAAGSTLVSLTSATDGNCQLLFGDTDSDTQGKIFYDNVSDYMSLHTNGGERARITSGGDLVVGRTVTINSARLTVEKDIANNIALFNNTSASSPYGIQVRYTGTTPNGTSNEFYAAYDNFPTVSLRFSVRSNGGIANYSANNVNLSDERVKTDIAPLGSMWDKFKAIEIVTFKYKDQTHDDNNIGVIAQQVESVAPEFVDVDGWSKEPPEDGVPLKSIYTEDLHHAAIKALQEAMTRIEELEAKVAALESK